MEYRKIITLKNEKTCTVRNGTEQDAQAVIDNFILTHWQTDYLASYQEEIPFTVEQECAYLKRRQESPFEAVFKAISELLDNKFDMEWKNVEIVNNENGILTKFDNKISLEDYESI